MGRGRYPSGDLARVGIIFDRDGASNHSAFRANRGESAALPVDGVVNLGLTGESALHEETDSLGSIALKKQVADVRRALPETEFGAVA